ncbi:nuclear transcription factor [Trypanosoma cruzi Dm28c]|uniref:Nuclear transcription factor n=1 Tax=Trypanosoma cruzi Dm28c TaxID=1416333 RepID=V5BUH3_TRYCR|nr:nuclear transcription factor [Trypanosoma cruzi Dm28c]KAF8276329.1 putative nuclear transcription factor [Trypanosoma cruzi]
METETELAKIISKRLKEGSYECAVCSELVRLRDKLWACSACHGIVHLSCVRFWVKVQTEEREKQRGTSGNTSCVATEFCCPLCRLINPTDALAEYKCFCGKVKDPCDDPLLVPGSCGQTCEKRRDDPKCVHPCTLMCHPGPCPPCSLTRLQSCYCGNSEMSVGCSSGVRGFNCGGVCGKLLDCGNHNCTALCHEGPCPICTVLATTKCHCGAMEKTLRCGENVPFSCNAVCGKPLDCGNHNCPVKCHEGPCKPCSRVPERQPFCPCGKVRVRQLLDSPRKSCLDPIPSCGLVCGARLPCNHTCSFLCHEGPVCPPCVEVVTSKCACGSSNIEYFCFCSYLPPEEWQEAAAKSNVVKNVALCYPPKCNKPCRKQLSCGKHTCKEICCSNEDHKCYRICTKRLSCGIHTCGQLCHKGACSPCSIVSYERLYCRCRRSWIEPPVPCGTKPPSCSHECVVPRPCGHPANHPCHIEEKCPVCVVPVEKRCASHKKVMPYFFPCFRQSISCGKKCGKPLRCCGQTCEKTCHGGPCVHQCANRFPAL